MGIHPYVDIDATLKLSRGRKKGTHAYCAAELAGAGDDTADYICQPCKLDSKTQRRLQTIIAGSIRAPQRLKHTGRVSTQQCPHAGCRAAKRDTEHLFWHCPAFKHIRQPFLDAIDKTLAKLDSVAKYRANSIRELLKNNTFKKCGIVPGDLRTLQCAYDIDLANSHLTPPTQEQRVTNTLLSVSAP